MIAVQIDPRVFLFAVDNLWMVSDFLWLWVVSGRIYSRQGVPHDGSWRHVFWHCDSRCTQFDILHHDWQNSCQVIQSPSGPCNKVLAFEIRCLLKFLYSSALWATEPGPWSAVVVLEGEPKCLLLPMLATDQRHPTTKMPEAIRESSFGSSCEHLNVWSLPELRTPFPHFPTGLIVFHLVQSAVDQAFELLEDDGRWPILTSVKLGIALNTTISANSLHKSS